MKRSYGLFAAVLVFSVLIGIQAFETADANPIPYPVYPSQEKPTITIKNLLNYSTYGVGSFVLDFSVVQPEAWSYTYDFFFHIGYVKNVTVSLDGKSLGTFSYNSSEYSLTINQTTSGTHKIEVAAFSCSYYLTAVEGIENTPSKYLVYDGVHPYEYWTTVSTTVYYSTSASATDLPTHITATPTSPPTTTPSSAPTYNSTPNPTSKSNNVLSPMQTTSPTPSPTPNQNMPTINTGAKLPAESSPSIAYLALMIPIAILAVVSVFLVYFKRRKIKEI
jgi:hypothetical protein